MFQALQSNCTKLSWGSQSGTSPYWSSRECSHMKYSSYMYTVHILTCTGAIDGKTIYMYMYRLRGQSLHWVGNLHCISLDGQKKIYNYNYWTCRQSPMYWMGNLQNYWIYMYMYVTRRSLLGRRHRAQSIDCPSNCSAVASHDSLIEIFCTKNYLVEFWSLHNKEQDGH